MNEYRKKQTKLENEIDTIIKSIETKSGVQY